MDWTLHTLALLIIGLGVVLAMAVLTAEAAVWLMGTRNPTTRTHPSTTHPQEDTEAE